MYPAIAAAVSLRDAPDKRTTSIPMPSTSVTMPALMALMPPTTMTFLIALSVMAAAALSLSSKLFVRIRGILAAKDGPLAARASAKLPPVARKAVALVLSVPADPVSAAVTAFDVE